MKKYLLEIVVFLCGAVVMMLELAGSRVMAPFLGTSLIVWSSLIGLILGALSLGYWFGGKLSDRDPNWRQFSGIILIAAVFVALTAWLKQPILVMIQTYIKDIRFGSLLATLILFAPASFLLGMISPYAVRLKIQNIDTSGEIVGNLYAISTLGSIFGTFLAGFYLLTRFGSSDLLYILAITLAVTSIIAFCKSGIKIKAAVLSVIILSAALAGQAAAISEKNGLIDRDSAYQRILIYNSKDGRTGRPTRLLKTDNFSVQSGIFLDGEDLVFDYTKFYRIARHFNPDIKTALMIGGAAYTYPRDFLREYPSSTMDVVEIDPMVTELAKKYFGLKDNPRLNIFHADGRIYLNQNTKRYDAIYGDAFKSYNPPYQLTTKESAERIYESLADNGVVLINIISSVEGYKGQFLRAEYKTFKELFPEVYVFAVSTPDAYTPQNLMLVAMKQKPASMASGDPELQKFLTHLWTKKITDDMPILTDDFAPVDNYLLKII
jgi:spermidine synthase